MIRLALTLSKNKVPVIYELGHYLADNILSKVNMVVAKKNKSDDLIFLNGKNGRTFDFPPLYKKVIERYIPNVQKYDDIVKDFHADRGMYQHRFESLKKTIRQPEAEKYVKFVEDIMRKAEIIREDEIITPMSLLSQFSSFGYNNRLITGKEKKYQILHNLLKSKDTTDLYIRLDNQIKDISIYDLKRTLIMEGGPDRYGTILLHNSKWKIFISRHGVSITDRKKQKDYSVSEPNKNGEVLNDFLKYF